MPGMGVFQATFFVPLQETGTFLAEESPWPVGPRNSGQSAARRVAEARRRKKRTWDAAGIEEIVFMGMAGIKIDVGEERVVKGEPNEGGEVELKALVGESAHADEEEDGQADDSKEGPGGGKNSVKPNIMLTVNA